MKFDTHVLQTRQTCIFWGALLQSLETINFGRKTVVYGWGGTYNTRPNSQVCLQKTAKAFGLRCGKNV